MPPTRFACITTSTMREHVRHLRELARVVVPGGRVFVFEHNPYNPVTKRIFERAPIDRGCHMIKPRAAAFAVSRRGPGGGGTGVSVVPSGTDLEVLPALSNRR